MELIRLYRTGVDADGLLLPRLRKVCPNITEVHREICYYILVDNSTLDNGSANDGKKTGSADDGKKTVAANYGRKTGAANYGKKLEATSDVSKKGDADDGSKNGAAGDKTDIAASDKTEVAAGGECTESCDPKSEVFSLEGEAACTLYGILGDPWLFELGLSTSPHIILENPETQILVEIGPRLAFTTAWSTNVVSVCVGSGIKRIKRLERAHRYLLTLSSPHTPELKAKIVGALHDPMTEQEYIKPLESFTHPVETQKWREVDVLKDGRKALETINKEMGLALDDWDLDYYTDLFVKRAERNPTTVELFDVAQSNSEHSRHWFFRGRYLVDGEEIPVCLLDMVRSTNNPDYTNMNNIIAFSDNSSCIKGWGKLSGCGPLDPTKCSEIDHQFLSHHLIFTAETHNFPTGVAPFSGATTGTGGRIRDVQAVGRGGHVVAGTAGYCFGNLLIPGYEQPWESTEAHYPSNFAPPLEVAIQASNGASDYGNKFGEPIIAGFARSFGLVVGIGKQTERREYIKPIMFTGGMGTVPVDMTQKMKPKEGDLVVKVGGPVYRIGVGGGAASSVQVQGDGDLSRDLGAVQRGDPEMEQKMNRVIRGCLEMNKPKVNPIKTIHDQGAGGNANVLKEILEGSGGLIFTESFGLGDQTLSTLEIWGAEYQESNALLINYWDLELLSGLAARERCPIDVVGQCTGDGKVRLVEGEMTAMGATAGTNPLPVDLHLDWVLGKMPNKEFHWTKKRIELAPLDLPKDLKPRDALSRVLRLPSVASKRYLTNKVDRSVTGLVAQQQCVGPLHTPLADVAVTAVSIFEEKGTATSIGEQPVKILVDPAAGARLTVLETLANLVAAPITTIKDVKCSANWMWPAKLPGEGWALFQACRAMCDIMKETGIAVDGGKDSLSMAARVPDQGKEAGGVVKAPGSLVISAYVPCTDVTKVVTPDLKSPGRTGSKGSLIWVRPVPEHARLAGTALAQVYGQVGREAPDVKWHNTKAFVDAFNLIQKLIKETSILSIHDVSDGGLVTCLLEMSIAGWGGLDVDLPPAPAPSKEAVDKYPPTLAALFSEEIGWVLEVSEESGEKLVAEFKKAGVPGTCLLGTTGQPGPNSKITIAVGGKQMLDLTVLEAGKLWEETSYQLDKLQANPDCVEEEYTNLATATHTTYHVPFTYQEFVKGPQPGIYMYIPKVGVIREEGTNGDREMVSALLQTGFMVYDVTMTDLLNGTTHVDRFNGLVFPGGFSYADVLGSGVGWRSVVEGGGLGKALNKWRQNSNHFSLGVCNGCQLMAHLGWLDPPKYSEERKPSVRLAKNLSGRFESRWSRVQVERTNSIMLKNMTGAKLGVWVAHGEGRFTYRNEKVEEELKGCVALRYLDHTDQPTTKYPYNPNGSKGGVAGICSPCGRHLALMPHPERCTMTWQWPYLPQPFKDPNTTAAPWAKIFQNAWEWCRKDVVD